MNDTAIQFTVIETHVTRTCENCWQVTEHSILTPSWPEATANKTCSHCGYVTGV